MTMRVIDQPELVLSFTFINGPVVVVAVVFHILGTIGTGEPV